MNILDINSLKKSDVFDIFQIADDIQKNPQQYVSRLKGKTAVLFFPEDSIRTRMSFEKGITSMGGSHILFPSKTLDKKEALVDVMGYLENWADFVVVRYKCQEKIIGMAEHSKIPIINAMSQITHPCEILSDLYSFRQLDNNYLEKTYTFVGENANILKTWVEACELLSFNLNHVFFVEERLKEDTLNYKFYINLQEIIGETDVLLTDAVPEEKRSLEYYDKYQISIEKLAMAKSALVINPCPPFTRGEEVTEEVINSSRFVGYGFKKNLLYVQQAIILKCLGLY